MITFTSIGGLGVRAEVGKKVLTVFADKAEPSATLALSMKPQEELKEGVISWPGEYDYDGISVRGIGHDEGKLVSYVIEMEGYRCAFLASPLREWTDQEIEVLGDISVLFLPADDAKIAQALLDDIDPRVFVPLPSKDEKTFAEVLKISGAQGKEGMSEYKIKGSLPAEGREVVVLKARK